MNIEQSREEFMNWLRTRPEVLNIGYDPKCGKFVLREDQERWDAWQASRQSLLTNITPYDVYNGSSHPDRVVDYFEIKFLCEVTK